MSDDQNTMTLVNRVELATLCGVSLPTIDTWVRQGCPVVERGSKGRPWQFHFSEVFNWRVLKAVNDAAARQ